MSKNLYIRLTLLLFAGTFIVHTTDGTEHKYSELTINNNSSKLLPKKNETLIALLPESKKKRKHKKSEDATALQQELENMHYAAKDITDTDSVWEYISEKFKNILHNDSEQVYLGIIIDDRGDLKDTHPIVTSVLPNSPAKSAGIQKNDTIISIDNKQITKLEDIIEIIDTKVCGDSLKVQIQRAGKIIEKDVLLTSFQRNHQWLSSVIDEKLDSCKKNGLERSFCKKIIMEKATPRLGAKVKELDEEAKQTYKAKDGGIRIVEVFKNSAADSVGLQADDIIIDINGHKITNISDIKAFLNNAGIPLAFTLKYIRNGRKQKVKGTITEFNQVWDNNSFMSINKVLE